MKLNRMYHELAYLCPLLSPPEEYAVEARYCRAGSVYHIKI